jgi:hypothetical protein
MLNKGFLFLNIFLVLFMMVLSSCSDRVSNEADCTWQIQNAASLAAARYISVINAIEQGESDLAIKDIDWWVDQSILELYYLEQKYPEKRLDDNFIPNTDIKMKRIYRDIARYRYEHSRVNNVPLTKEQMKLIENFVEKYR